MNQNARWNSEKKFFQIVYESIGSSQGTNSFYITKINLLMVCKEMIVQ